MRTRREIQERITQLISRHGISSPPIPVDEIAKAEGLPIIEHDFDGDISGALITAKGVSAIAVNGNQHINRRRFTIAHELAHHLLGHQAAGEDHLDWKFTVLRRDGVSSEASDTREIEANIFAANLLMPREFLFEDLRAMAGRNGEVEFSPDLLQKLARRYKVSETAMNFRLINLGLITPT